jgi:hypothetical protein
MAGRMMAHATAEPYLERRLIYRHSVVVRIVHWINVICFTLLLMSGLQIFNAHPVLYWGQQSTFDAPFVALQADPGDDAKGITRIAGYNFDTTGVLGVSKVDGVATERGFRPAVAFFLRLAAADQRFRLSALQRADPPRAA